MRCYAMLKIAKTSLASRAFKRWWYGRHLMQDPSARSTASGMSCTSIGTVPSVTSTSTTGAMTGMPTTGSWLFATLTISLQTCSGEFSREAVVSNRLAFSLIHGGMFQGVCTYYYRTHQCPMLAGVIISIDQLVIFHAQQSGFYRRRWNLR